MGLFSKERSYLGVDIGSTSIKLVELMDANGVPELVTYGLAELATLGRNGTAPTAEELAETITHMCKEAGTVSRKACTALPSHSVFTSILSMPKMSRAERATAVKWEAKKVMPLPVEEMSIDSLVIDPNGPSGTDRVLLTGAPKTVAQKYVDIFKKTNLTLLSLETEGFALIRSLVGADKAPVMVIDFGAASTDILIVENGSPFLNRSIEGGGNVITRSLAQSLNVSADRAEQFKYDVGMSAMSTPSSSEIPKTINAALAPVINEIKYTLNLYQSQSHKKVEKVILAGGSALLINFTNYLSEVLGLRVYIGDPWARVRYPLELKGVLQESAARFSVAIGLAMREIK
jgi:type IV pilus assembly protein PilM